MKEDKAFFFVDYEGIRQLFEENKTATVPACNLASVCKPTTANPVSAQAIINTLAIYPKPDVLIGGGLGLAATYGVASSIEYTGVAALSGLRSSAWRFCPRIQPPARRRTG